MIEVVAEVNGICVERVPELGFLMFVVSVGFEGLETEMRSPL